MKGSSNRSSGSSELKAMEFTGAIIICSELVEGTYVPYSVQGCGASQKTPCTWKIYVGVNS